MPYKLLILIRLQGINCPLLLLLTLLYQHVNCLLSISYKLPIDMDCRYGIILIEVIEMNKEIIEEGMFCSLHKEILSDGSPVYNVWVRQVRIDMSNLKTASELFESIESGCIDMPTQFT